jgi:hypothetical membrane protein
MSVLPRRRATGRVKEFTLRYPLIGPAVWVLSITYFVAQCFAAQVWRPNYSFVTNTISDLGNTVCGSYHGSYLCSPRHGVMNASFVLLGTVMAAGSLLICQEFSERGVRERVAAYIGFSFLAVGGAGAVLVGAFPENTVAALHYTGAALAIGVGNLGVAVLGWTLRLPRGMRWYMRITSLASLVALALFATGTDLGIGAGLMERFAAYPETVWLITFGLYISWSHELNRVPAISAADSRQPQMLFMSRSTGGREDVNDAS